MTAQVRRLHRTPLVLIAIVIAIAVMTIAAATRYALVEDKIRFHVPENRLWAASQAELELLRFVDELDRQAARAPGDPSELEMRFDILWSRLGLYEGGEIGAWLRSQPELANEVERFKATLDAIDADVRGFRQGDRSGADAIRSRLLPFMSLAHRITLVSLDDDRRQRETLGSLHDKLRSTLLLLSGLLTAALAVLFVYLMRSEHRARQLLLSSTDAQARADAATQRLAEAIENINEGFVLYDADDRLIVCNERYRSCYDRSTAIIEPGRRFEEIIRYGVERGQYPQADGREEQWVAERLRLRRQLADPFEQQLADGRWVMVSDRLTRDGGIVGIRTDITLLKRRESDLEEAQRHLLNQAETMRALADEAQRASRAKSEFLAVMSHEIRTPMNGVLVALHLLSEHPLSTEDQTLVLTARHSAESLLAILNDILDLSKIEAGRLTLEPDIVDIDQLVTDVVSLCGLQARKKGLDLRAELAPDVPAHIRADGGRLRQMLLNYLTNAVKFTEQGEIEVSVSRLRTEQGERLKLCVRDTGIGIAEAKQGDIFGEFVQVDGSTARRHGGTGLGLAITRRLANLMGGQVGFESEHGIGSRFWFEIPLEEVAPHAADVAVGADDAKPLVGGGNLRALLVEDNPTNQLLGRKLLEQAGFAVDVACDGAASIEASASTHYDIIFMDISMPVMDGFEATCALRELGVRVPILALTANTGAEIVARCNEVGMNGCLTKPIRKNALYAELRKHLAFEDIERGSCDAVI